MAEIWNLYDENRNLTDETMVRGDEIPEGRYHLVVHVWIRDDQGRFLISKRHPQKIGWPNFWETTGGSVVAGEDSLTGAIREVEEELGISLSPDDLVLLTSERREWGRDFMDTWMARWNGDLSEITLQEGETVDARWVTYDELRALDDGGVFVDTLRDYRMFFAGVQNAPVAVCPMTMADYDEVYNLWLRTPGMGVNDHDDSPEGIARFLERNAGCSFVAKSAGGILGAGLAGHDGRRGYLYHTAVAQEAQGRGIGRALVDASVEALRRQGVGKVGLHVFGSNEAGTRFWKKYGFDVRGDVLYCSHKVASMTEKHVE